MDKQALWIWFPGEFEMFLGLRMWSTRYERQTIMLPNWRVETTYPNIAFRKEWNFQQETTLHIRTDGEKAVMLDEQFVQHVDEELTVPAGRHMLVITVFNRDTFPALYIQSDSLVTDASWEVTCFEGEWKQAASWNFSDPTLPPSTFTLDVHPVSPVSVEPVNGGTLYDFGREMMAFLRYKGQGSALVTYGESREEALNYRNSEWCDEIVINGEWITDYTRAFRYVYLPDSSQVILTDVLYQYLPIQNRGTFHCDDERMNRIYDTAVYTLQLNSREFLLDGIKRDRWVWSGDATQSYLLQFYSFLDLPLCQRTMRLLRGKDPVRIHLNTIQDYTCYWFISLLDYYLYTGDTEFLAQMYPAAQSLMEFCLERTDARGFMMAVPGDWVFVDWAPIDNSGDVAVIQLLYARALEAMSTVARLLGHEEEAEQYGVAHQHTLTSCFSVFWSESYGCFTHGPAADDNAVVTRYPNMFAVLFGYLNDAQRQNVITHVLTNPYVLPITTPYMRFYEMMALCECGLADTVWDHILWYWGGMLERDATTFWEEFNPEQTGEKQYAMYGRPYGKSLCHAWGAGPILLFGRYFLGVRPTSPGYATFEVRPQSIDISMNGTVPTVRGPINLTIDSESVTVVNDSSGTGTLIWKGHSVEILPWQTVTL